MCRNTLNLDIFDGSDIFRRSDGLILPHADAAHAGIDAQVDAHRFSLGKMRVGLGFGRAGDNGNESFLHHRFALARQTRTQKQNVFLRHRRSHGARFA
jgi:hypothetical protein